MESKSPNVIALEIGAPTTNLLGTQDWSPALHPGVIVSELHYSDDTPLIAFRVRDGSGIILSKLEDENAPGDVDAVFSNMLAITQKVELELKPALYAAIPDLDTTSETLVRGLSVGGKDMIGDIVNGQIVNIREPSVFPVISVDEDGKLQVDTSTLKLSDKIAADAAIDVIVKSAPVLEAVIAIKG